MDTHGTITIGQQRFTSRKDAVSYFMAPRRELKASDIIADGPFFTDLQALYILYCNLLPYPSLNSGQVVHFTVEYEPFYLAPRWIMRPRFEVLLKSGVRWPFPVERIINTIVKASQ